jgi:hypothetical protein
MSMFNARMIRPMRCVLVGAALAVLGACNEPTPTAPIRPAAGEALGGLFSSSGPTLVSCSTDESMSTRATFDNLGGTLSLDGSSVFLPLDALLGPTELELTIPASKYMEISVKANGGHFDFEQPIFITIDYSRCQRSDLLWKKLTVWYIDSETKRLIENMGGIDNKLLQRITFTTSHLSGYAIAF